MDDAAVVASGPVSPLWEVRVCFDELVATELRDDVLALQGLLLAVLDGFSFVVLECRVPLGGCMDPTELAQYCYARHEQLAEVSARILAVPHRAPADGQPPTRLAPAEVDRSYETAAFLGFDF